MTTPTDSSPFLADLIRGIVATAPPGDFDAVPDTVTHSSPFPADFVFGVAAAPQIEGAAFEDGKGESLRRHHPGAPHPVDTTPFEIHNKLETHRGKA